MHKIIPLFVVTALFLLTVEVSGGGSRTYDAPTFVTCNAL
jgi:hypothetical protein